MKILFITSNRVGDAVLTTGVLDWLVRKHPEASFTVACGPYAADLFAATPRLERLIVMKKKKFNGHWLELWKQCIGTRWDLVVDFRNSVVSRLLCAKQRAIYSHNGGQHKVLENASVLKLDPPPNPHIWVSYEAEDEAEKIVPKDKPILALGPAANWPLKQWPIEYFIQLGTALTSPQGLLPNAPIMILADTHEREQIAPLLQSLPAERRIDVIGYDLQTAAACLKRARLYIGNDSGLMHMAAALGTPTLGLFGPGFPNIYGPWGKRCAYVTTPETREELLAKAKNQTPPPDTLMRTLSVEKVKNAAENLLRNIR